MKNKYSFKISALLFAVLFLTVFGVSAQTTAPNPANFQNFIDEVYVGEGADQITPNTRRFDYMQELYLNRIIYSVQDSSHDTEKGYLKLSEIPLFDFYNTQLIRDQVFDPATFNPFKYNFSYYSQTTQAIRVDGTNYLIVIKAQ